MLIWTSRGLGVPLPGSHKGATWAVTALAATAPFYTHEMSHQDGEGLVQGHSRSKRQDRSCEPGLSAPTASVFGGKKEVRETYQGQQTEQPQCTCLRRNL